MTDIILLQLHTHSDRILVPTVLLSMAQDPIERGYNVVLIDQRINKDWRDDMKKHIIKGAKIVYVACEEEEQLIPMLEATKLAIQLNPKTITILGGNWASTHQGMGMQDTNIEIVSYDKNYSLLTDIMEYFERKKRMTDIPGIFYRGIEGASIKKTEKKDKPLNKPSKIPWYLVNLNSYQAIEWGPSLPRQEGNDPDFSVTRAIGEFENLGKDRGIKKFFITDNQLIEKHFEEFVDKLAKSSTNYIFGVSGNWAEPILSFTKASMDNLVKSGCKMLEIEAYSGNNRLLDLIHQQTADTIRKANQKLSSFPIKLKYKFQGGFPSETEEEFLTTLHLMKILQKENKYATVSLSFYIPSPGNVLYPLAIEQGFKPPTSLKDWAENNKWYKKDPCWLTKKRVKIVDNAAFISHFSDKHRTYPGNLPSYIASKMRYPLAKIRYNKAIAKVQQ